MYLLSNTQIYKNANYISVKFPFKALKLLTYCQKKSIKKGTINFKFQFFKIPNSKT
jgi:hypothetical protein